MQQGSLEWHEFRQNKIGASDAPVIMGVSPWKNIIELWEEKVGLKFSQRSNFYQERGLSLEYLARQYFYMITGYEVFPDICVSSTYSWMMASLDGMSEDKKILLEIKCPGEKDHRLALNNQIPEKYYPQLQHQLEVVNLDSGFYLSFDGKEGKLIQFYRDQNYITNLIKKEYEFYQCVLNFTPPKINTGLDELRWENASFLLKSIIKKQKELSSQESVLKNTLIGLSNDQNVDSHGIKLTKFIDKSGSKKWKFTIKE